MTRPTIARIDGSGDIKAQLRALEPPPPPCPSCNSSQTKIVDCPVMGPGGSTYECECDACGHQWQIHDALQTIEVTLPQGEPNLLDTASKKA